MKRRLALIIFLAASCKQKADPNEAMWLPKPPPPPTPHVPESLDIPVEIEGKPGASITAKILSARKPEYSDDDRRAWSIAGLIGEPADRSDTVFTIIGDANFRVTMLHPRKPADLVPVLMLSRRGDITASMVKPDDPFPTYHGQGRRLERGGDPLPRVAKSVAKIVVTYDANAVASMRGDTKPQEIAAHIEIVLDGKAMKPWSEDEMRAVATKKFPSGDAARDSWSLRDIVHALAGKNARVTAIGGAGRRRLLVDQKAWDDPSQTPTLRLNRQGLFKFQWVGDRRALAAEAELRNVHILELETPR